MIILLLLSFTVDDVEFVVLFVHCKASSQYIRFSSTTVCNHCNNTGCFRGFTVSINNQIQALLATRLGLSHEYVTENTFRVTASVCLPYLFMLKTLGTVTHEVLDFLFVIDISQESVTLIFPHGMCCCGGRV